MILKVKTRKLIHMIKYVTWGQRLKRVLTWTSKPAAAAADLRRKRNADGSQVNALPPGGRELQ